jgi:hypothetical protein
VTRSPALSQRAICVQAPKKERAEDDEDVKALKLKAAADAKALKDARDKGEPIFLLLGRRALTSMHPTALKGEEIASLAITQSCSFVCSQVVLWVRVMRVSRSASLFVLCRVVTGSHLPFRSGKK